MSIKLRLKKEIYCRCRELSCLGPDFTRLKQRNMLRDDPRQTPSGRMGEAYAILCATSRRRPRSDGPSIPMRRNRKKRTPATGPRGSASGVPTARVIIGWSFELSLRQCRGPYRPRTRSSSRLILCCPRAWRPTSWLRSQRRRRQKLPPASRWSKQIDHLNPAKILPLKAEFE
jgi:hypothetical protein